MKVKQGYEARARRINMIQEHKHMRMAGGGGGGQQQRPIHIQQQQQQQLAARQGAAPSSSIRIANVSSLAQPASQKANLNLPSSISISRIEPDISIVSERISPNKTAPPVSKPRQLPASTQLTRQLTPQQALQQQRARQLMRQRQQQMPHLSNGNRLVGPGQVALQQQQQQRRLTPQAQYAQMQRQRTMMPTK